MQQVPTNLYPKLLDFCSELEPDSAPCFVVSDPIEGPAERNCFHLVEQRVAAQGGRAVHGWQIWDWPSRLLEAEFHAVWENPAGLLVDITPKSRITTDRIVFLRSQDCFAGTRVPSRCKALLEHPRIREYISAQRVYHEFLAGLAQGYAVQFTVDAATKARHDILQTDTFEKCERVLGLPSLGRKQPCWCGSKKKLKNCHDAQ